MRLPSAAELVRAFIADLGNVFGSTELGASEETSTVVLNNSAQGVLAWVPDEDFYIVGVTTGTSAALLTANIAFATLVASSRRIPEAIFCFPSSSTLLITAPMRIPINSGQKLYFSSNGAMSMTLFLVKR
jgi:hypothetical protein